MSAIKMLFVYKCRNKIRFAHFFTRAHIQHSNIHSRVISALTTQSTSVLTTQSTISLLIHLTTTPFPSIHHNTRLSMSFFTSEFYNAEQLEVHLQFWHKEIHFTIKQSKSKWKIKAEWKKIERHESLNRFLTRILWLN